MVDAPDLDAAVFMRLLRDAQILGKGTEEDGLVDGHAGDIAILRWSDARLLLDAGDAELV
ncbi:MAG: hypothetical protein OK454_04420 [Thaumarchaeota archaeon]|nr:hypothetical protein [Nitrososphaerota archaeon]